MKTQNKFKLHLGQANQVRDNLFSGPDQDHLLAENNNFFLMDNHRLATWCFYQKLKMHQTYHLLHVDAHFDMTEGVQEKLIEKRINVKNLSLSDYQNLRDENTNSKLIRFDNYLPLIWSSGDFNIKQVVSMTHEVGQRPKTFKLDEISPYHALPSLKSLFITQHSWVVNIDFDYFYSRQEKKFLMFSEEYIIDFFSKIKLAYDDDMIAVVTLALSPECCGGWKESQKVLELFQRVFGPIFDQII